MNNPFIVIGGVFIFAGIVHELRWWRRRGGKLVRGTVIDHVKVEGLDGDTMFALKVEYQDGDGSHQFESTYYDSHPLPKGRTVDVVIPPRGGDPEVRNMVHRTLLTVGPILLGLLMVVVGLNVTP